MRPLIAFMLQQCRHSQTNGSGRRMLCRMPTVNLPAVLKEQLENNESGTINNTRGPGVAVYVSSDGHVRSDIYIGLKLDGVKRYRNISFLYPNIKMEFAIAPIVSCGSEDLNFDPVKEKVIAIKVSLYS